jgi:hypothetical protein
MMLDLTLCIKVPELRFRVELSLFICVPLIQ